MPPRKHFDLLDVHKAASVGTVAVVREALEANFKAGTTDSAGRTLLHTAITGRCASHGEIVALLLAHQPSLADVQDASGQTALHLAAGARRMDVVIQLLEAGASVNLLNEARQTPLDVEPALANVMLEHLQSPPAWVLDQDAPRCMLCAATFTMTNRRHHCRHCGRVICRTCSDPRRQPILKFSEPKPVRLCVRCYPIVAHANQQDSRAMAGDP